ncbi:MAG: Cell division protein FtsQ [Alphaproteobacteria bacterium MarineAlpha2_Bin1]|nr:MAG: Cell division protein FtsQ [Alphaproteobacteria bacterium MarineAlpha2_Bin1]
MISFKYIYISRIRILFLSLVLFFIFVFIFINIFNKYETSYIFIQNSINEFSKKIGLSIKNVQVTGLINSDRNSIENITKVIYGDATIFTDIGNIKQSLEKIDWIDIVEVKRVYPDKITINVREKSPFALWQNENELYLISNDGSVITKRNINNYKNFPLVVGPDAPMHAGKLVKLLYSDLEIYKRVTASTRIGMRRWDILIDGRIKILLPENDYSQAWQKLIKLQKTKNILDRKILMIDFRDRNRLIIRLMPGVIDEINQAEEMT